MVCPTRKAAPGGARREQKGYGVDIRLALRRVGRTRPSGRMQKARPLSGTPGPTQHPPPPVAAAAPVARARRPTDPTQHHRYPLCFSSTATRAPARERGQTEWLAVLLCPLRTARIGLERNRRRKNRSLSRDYCRTLPHGNGPRGQALSASWGRFGACDGRLPPLLLGWGLGGLVHRRPCVAGWVPALGRAAGETRPSFGNSRWT